MKRKVNRTYNSILNVLREYPNGFTASQIFENFEKVNKRKVKKTNGLLYIKPSC